MGKKKAVLGICVSAMLLAGCAGEGARTDALQGDGQMPQAISQEVYPGMSAYPDETAYQDDVTGVFDDTGFQEAYQAWLQDRSKLREQTEEYAGGMQAFFAKSAGTFLTADADQGKNAVYSPLNVYMALAMLAETTGGESRRQILELLGMDAIETLRTQADAVWKGHYCADGAVTSVLANALWLDTKVEYVPETLERLTQYYHASSFRGEMGSPAYNEVLQEWINEQTGGLLKEQASGLSLDPETVLALTSAIYYRGRWSHEFWKDNTKQEIFHLPGGGEQLCDFMKRSDSAAYYLAEHFRAVSLSIEGDGQMWFLLPDEGVTPQQLLTEPETMAFLRANGNWEQNQYLMVHLAVPKFDVVSDLDLREGLMALGISDVFDAGKADFTPMTTAAQEIFLGQAQHASRVMIDEEGVIAAAYTMMAVCGAGMPPQEEVEFVLDRPFLFALTAYDGLPLFIGVVNQP